MKISSFFRSERFQSQLEEQPNGLHCSKEYNQIVVLNYFFYFNVINTKSVSYNSLK